LADFVIKLRQHQQQFHQLSPQDHYLSIECTSDQDILLFWQLHVDEYLDLAQMAMDFLAVPVSGASVERLLSAARQICFYQHNQLHASTIKRLMIVQPALKCQMGYIEGFVQSVSCSLGQSG
jgi:hypothetical protein